MPTITRMDRAHLAATTTDAAEPCRRWGEKAGTILTNVGIALLYLLGVVHWSWFFNCGHLTFQAYDWPKEAMYFQVLRQALVYGRMPYHIAVPPDCEQRFTHLRGGRFLGLPETLLSPQIVLLPWLKTGRFILLHVLLMYTLGFAGSLALQRRYKLGFVAFATWFILFNFNGYIVAHLGAGHSMWSGYFLLPFVVLFVFECVEQPGLLRPAFWLALIFFVMLLQGSFHLVIWCWMFVGLLVATWPRLWKQGLIAVAFSGFMAAFRLIPTAVTYWGFHEYSFLGGYPTLDTIAEALVVVRDPEALVDIGSPWKKTELYLHWWEYDLYIGAVGLAVLVYFGIFCRLSRDVAWRSWRYAAFDVPMLMMTLLSLSYLYWPIYNLPIPLLNSERVASRFIVVPFVIFLATACLRIDAERRRVALGWIAWVAMFVGLGAMALPLVYHSSVWLIELWEHDPKAYWMPVQSAALVELKDPAYVASLWFGAGVSVIAIAAWVSCFRYCSRNQLKSHPLIADTVTTAAVVPPRRS